VRLRLQQLLTDKTADLAAEIRFCVAAEGALAAISRFGGYDDEQLCRALEDIAALLLPPT
jgi:DNA-binding phage protein